MLTELTLYKKSIDICRELDLKPNLIYPTFNFKPSNPRHRIVFIAPNIIYDADLRDRVQNKLIDIFHSDPNSRDRARQFAGGKIILWPDERARLDIDKLLELDVEKGVKNMPLNNVQKLIQMGDSENYQQYLQDRGVSMTPRSFQNSYDLMKYLKSVDLSIALDLPSECLCIFHDDVHPSATIFRSNSVDWLYYCRTKGCI